jgi:hypothetical protein
LCYSISNANVNIKDIKPLQNFENSRDAQTHSFTSDTPQNLNKTLTGPKIPAGINGESIGGLKFFR